MILIKNLFFRYSTSKDWILKDVSLSIDAGELVVIVGPNGSGKTTLGYLISGIIPNFYGGYISGEISVLGRDPTRCDINELSKDVAFIFTNPHWDIVAPLVISNIAFGLENRGLPPNEILSAVEEIAEFMEIQHILNKPVATLSSGEKRLVSIASALITNPKIIIMDEPFSLLDGYYKSLLLKTVEKLRRRNITIIIIEHNMDIVHLMQPRLIAMNNGEIVFDGSYRDFFSRNLWDFAGLPPPLFKMLFPQNSIYDVEDAIRLLRDLHAKR